jgi:hypothetical protein
MRKGVAILLVFTVLSACSTKSSTDATQVDTLYTDTTSLQYKPLELRRIYTQMRGMNGMNGYTHFVVAENYREDEDNFLVKYADEYLDTCKSQLPVWEIIFCKPFDFSPTYDSQDLEPLFNHALVSIGYLPDTVQRKFPDIESVSFWKNGKRSYIQLNTIERRNRKNELNK